MTRRLYFYPRPPGGGRPISPDRFKNRVSFLSTPSGWRATRRAPRLPGITCVISIHALRVEGDLTLLITGRGVEYFYPRPPGGGRLDTEKCYQILYISIHALRVEGDSTFRQYLSRCPRFLSTPSGWRATGLDIAAEWAGFISIHALRVEGDSKNGQSFRLFLRKREKNLPL